METLSKEDEYVTSTYILMSIVTKQARKILEGSKHWEFRKSLPQIPPETDLNVIIYSSQEDKAVIGRFAAGRILRCSFDDLMQTTGYSDDPEALIWFQKYYGDRATCSALEVIETTTYQTPLRLDTLRAEVPDFRPPQNFIYLEPDMPLYEAVVQ